MVTGAEETHLVAQISDLVLGQAGKVVFVVRVVTRDGRRLLLGFTVPWSLVTHTGRHRSDRGHGRRGVHLLHRKNKSENFEGKKRAWKQNFSDGRGEKVRQNTLAFLFEETKRPLRSLRFRESLEDARTAGMGSLMALANPACWKPIPVLFTNSCGIFCSSRSKTS